MLRILFSIYIILIISPCYALEEKSYAKGWYWGEDKNTNELKEKPLNKPTVKSMAPTYTQKDVLDSIESNVEELKAKAILNPTTKNVTNYIKAQNRVVNLASNFSEGWSKAQLASPELNYTAKNPTNNYAKRLISEQREVDMKIYLNNFSREFGIVFFFNGNDKISVYQSKIIKEFASNNGISLIPVSMTGASNQYFKKPRLNNGQAELMNVTVTPAVIALNIKTKQSTPLIFGVTTENELNQRIYNLYQKGY